MVICDICNCERRILFRFRAMGCSRVPQDMGDLSRTQLMSFLLMLNVPNEFGVAYYVLFKTVYRLLVDILTAEKYYFYVYMYI